MAGAQTWYFGDYRLDLQQACLWRGAQALHLTPKAFAVLQALVQHAGQLMTKDALLQAAWPETAVSEAALTICMSELRKVLGETAKAPRYIATVHRRGYRFLAEVNTVLAEASAPLGTAAGPAVPMTPCLVGYDVELGQLHACFAVAQGGQRQVVLVAGDAGIGKTTLVDTFLAQLSAPDACWVAWGQCLAHYGEGEAYLPVLDALGCLGRGPAQASLRAVLRQYAPTWLAQLPALASTADGAAPAQGLGPTPTRMLRELAEALDVLTGTQPLVLVLEDLHWSDHATLDLLTWLARRREPARLLVVGTYRPVDVIVHRHPLQAVQQDLALHQQCVEIRLDGLSPAAVDAYLAARFPGGPLPPELAEVVAQRTAGQPLFLVHMVDAWRRDGRVVAVDGQWVVPGGLTALATDIPASVRQLIEQQLEGCSPEEQRVLEAASVAGETFAAAAVAAGLDVAVAEVEAWCAGLVRRGQFLRESGVEGWPDGTVAERYGFRHALHQQVVYDRLAASWRMQLHRRIGLRKEAGYGERGQEITAELARHFAQGRDDARAVVYLRQAGDRALMRSACREAMAYFEQALSALAHLPETRETQEQAIGLWLALRAALQPLGELERVLTCLRTAEALATALDDPPRLAHISLLLSRYYSLMGLYPQASTAAQRALTFTTASGEAVLQALANLNLGLAYQPQGDYRQAIACFEQTVVALDRARGRALFGQTILPVVNACAHLALCHAEMGTFAEGCALGHEGLQIAEAVGHPGSLMVAYWGVGLLARRQGDLCRALPELERALCLCEEADLPMWFPTIAVELGAAYTLGGRVADAMPLLTRALEQSRGAPGSQASGSVSLGAAHLRAGCLEDAHRLTAGALASARAHHERGRKATALYLLGAIAAQREPPDVELAATHYGQALALAKALGMRPLQAHCHYGQGTLYAQTGQTAQAREALSAALTLYRAMDMTFWLPSAEAALAQVEG